MKIKKLTKIFPKRMQTKRYGYLGVALVMLFSSLSYSLFIKQAPQVQAATVGTSSSNTATSTPEQRRIVQSINGTLVTVYNAGTESPTGIAFRTSTDNGDTWSSGTQIDSANTSDFSIALDGSDNIYVAFSASGALKSRKLTYSGGSWTVGSAVTINSATTCVTSSTNGVDYLYPTIAVNASGKVWINSTHKVTSSSDCSTVNTQYLRTWSSTDGSSWTQNANYLTLSTTITRPSPIISTGKDIWLLSTNDVSSYKILYIDMGSAGGWVKVAESTSLVNANETSIAYGLDEIHILSRYAGNDIRYQKFSLTTNTFSSVTTISSDVNDRMGSITTDSYNVWAIYRDDVGANSYNIVYKRFNGTSWDGSFTSITTDNAANIAPTVPHRLRNTINLPVIWNTGTSSPYTIKSSVFSSIGTATDSGNLSGSYSGSLTGSTGDHLVKSGSWYYNSVNIVSGMTIRVLASDGVMGGSLTIYSNSVTVAGQINGSGRGNAGGVNVAGIGGEPSSNGTSLAGGDGAGPYGSSGGTAGTNGAGGAAGTDTIYNSTYYTATTGGGGGGGGTTGGSSSLAGYLGSGVNGDTSTDESLTMGSGGGAGGGGGSGGGGGIGGAGNSIFVPGPGGVGANGGQGGKGGNGGANIQIRSTGNVTISGSILNNGQSASSASAGSTGTAGGNPTSCGGC